MSKLLIAKKTVLLTKILLKNGIGTQAAKAGKNEKQKGFRLRKLNKRALIPILLVIAFIPFAINIVFLASYIYDSLAQIQQQGLLLSLGIGLASFIVFFFGLFYVINVFYFANDIETLLPLPLKPSEIITAKFFTVIVYEYITEAIIILPIFGVYAVKSGVGITFYLFSLLIFFLLPIIPLSLSSILVMFIMRFTNIARNKDRFKLIGGIVAVFLSIGINIVIQRATMRSIEPQALQDILLQGGNSLVELLGKTFPGTKFAAVGLVNSMSLIGLINIFTFLVIVVITFLLFIYLSEFLYFKGVIGISESTGVRNIGIEELRRRSVRSPKLKAYLIKEIKLLLRTPVYFLNCVFTAFLWPLFLIIMPIFSSGKSDGGEGIDINMLRNLVQEDKFAGIVLVILFAAIIFVSGGNAITSTAISREGQLLYINKYLPISYATQLYAKILSGVIISTMSMLIIVITLGIILKLPVMIVFLSIISGFTAIFLISLVGIIIDLYNPKLNWDNEQKAVKQNMNVFFHMLISIGIATIIIFISIKFLMNFNLYSMFISLVFVFGLIDIILYKLLANRSSVLFANIEN